MMTEFEVKGYKALADVRIPLTPIHVLIGQNDSGKTSVLEAILALSRSTTKNLADSFGGAWKGRDLVFHDQEAPEIKISSSFQEPESSLAPETFQEKNIGYRLNIEFPFPDRQCQVIGEYITIDQSKADLSSPNQSLTRVYRRAEGEIDVRTRCEIVASQLENVQYYRFDAKTMSLPAAIDENRTFRMDTDGFGLATLLDDLNSYEPEIFILLRNEFCELFPQFRTIHLVTRMASHREYSNTGLHQMTNRTGKGIEFETVARKKVPAQQASDGALLFLGFLALMYLPTPPKLLLIEEPEKGVYPQRLEQIMEMIRKKAEGNQTKTFPQIIMTTHSPHLLSRFRPEEVTLMKRMPDGSCQAFPLRDSEVVQKYLGPYYLGELWYNFTEEELLGHVEPADMA